MLRMLLAIVTGLLCMHLFLLWLREGLGMEARALTMLFDLDHEANIPTLFSVLLFASAGVLLLISYRTVLHAGRRQWQWRLLAFIFFFLALDEGSQIHEKCIEAVHRLMGGIPHASLTYAWVIPYGLAVVGLALVMAPFLLKLRKRTLWLFIISAAVYVGGALITEMLQGAATVDGGETSLLYLLLNTKEETLEMIGLALFNYALLDHLSGGHTTLTLSLSPDP
ncbi:MAG: hypothetical protein IPG74_11935 [Flavobacteriales bacterium]|nr:hypothetical protein [Flavobacteriales bacterium]